MLCKVATVIYPQQIVAGAVLTAKGSAILMWINGRYCNRRSKKVIVLHSVCLDKRLSTTAPFRIDLNNRFNFSIKTEERQRKH